MCDAVFLRQCNQRLRYTAQFLCFGNRGLDNFMFDQRRCHVTEHGFSMRAVSIQFSTGFLMTHGLVLCLSILAVCSAQALTRLSGGQFSNFIPSDRSCDAKTSLISVRD